VISVSLDVTAVPDQPVGAGRYTIELARALRGRGDVELLLWSRRSDAARWREAGPDDHTRLRAEAPDRRVSRLAWEQLRLPGLLHASGTQVHHGPHYTMPARARQPVVVTIHDMTFFDHPEWHERAKVPVFRHAIRRAARRADALVCVSRHTADRLADLLEVCGRVFVVPHGIDHERFRPVAPEPAADDAVLQGIGVRPPYVLFLGTLEPRKAVPDLVRAFAVLAGEDRELQLVLAGRPAWGAAEVAAAVEESGVAERVVVTGYVGDDAVAPLLRTAAVVAYPAHEEGFGLPALEALACGAPLVTTEGTAMAEMAGGAALLVPPNRVDLLAEAIDAARQGGAEAQARRRLGLGVAAEHTWDRCAEAHVDAYRWATARGSDFERREGPR
jgi:glycosyltransferase involved in cell wall biosynthesis